MPARFSVHVKTALKTVSRNLLLNSDSILLR